MQKYYYTFGSDERFPYQGGWVEVMATSFAEAHAKFRARFPDRHQNCLNCSDYYDQGRMEATEMLTTGNRGAFCHEVIK
ncbi:hypothetical protein LJC64_02430 [Ruminococcaceae bacterium OttesenSCG-928-A11]|nr:hypothetical protein [Ruminococcaceae bacterium OttesenSCG-928-A11]